jgi:hypothetical protein
MDASLSACLAVLLLCSGVARGGQPALDRAPVEKMSVANQIAAMEVLRRPDFTFKAATQPTKVRLATMDRLFDNPRLAAAMWRECQFVPKLWASTLPGRALYIDDTQGLSGTLTLAYREPGVRVYLIEGRVAKGRMGNPFPVSASMVVIYKYWDGPKGFQSQIQAWTRLDSALLGVLTRPFRRYVQHRQEEFIVYIMGNMAQGGEFAESTHDDFLGPIQREGDPVAIRAFRRIFRKRS